MNLLEQRAYFDETKRIHENMPVAFTSGIVPRPDGKVDLSP
jgi:hypothetical protein